MPGWYFLMKVATSAGISYRIFLRSPQAANESTAFCTCSLLWSSATTKIINVIAYLLDGEHIFPISIPVVAFQYQVSLVIRNKHVVAFRRKDVFHQYLQPLYLVIPFRSGTAGLDRCFCITKSILFRCFFTIWSIAPKSRNSRHGAMRLTCPRSFPLASTALYCRIAPSDGRNQDFLHRFRLSPEGIGCYKYRCHFLFGTEQSFIDSPSGDRVIV